jgi:hypothetical protein
MYTPQLRPPSQWTAVPAPRATALLAAGLVCSLAAVVAGCGGDDSTGPTTGSIAVTTTTTGSDLDADGYTVSVDGGAAQAIGINETKTVSQVSTGSRSVTLGGVAANAPSGVATRNRSRSTGAPRQR